MWKQKVSFDNKSLQCGKRNLEMFEKFQENLEVFFTIFLRQNVSNTLLGNNVRDNEIM